jgi:hypothetical protein
MIVALPYHQGRVAFFYGKESLDIYLWTTIITLWIFLFTE